MKLVTVDEFKGIFMVKAIAMDVNWSLFNAWKALWNLITSN